MQYVPLYDKTSHSIHVYFSDRKGNLDRTYNVHVPQYNKTSHSIYYFLTPIRRGSLGSMYLHTIKPHIQFIIF